MIYLQGQLWITSNSGRTDLNDSIYAVDSSHASKAVRVNLLNDSCESFLWQTNLSKHYVMHKDSSPSPPFHPSVSLFFLKTCMLWWLRTDPPALGTGQLLWQKRACLLPNDAKEGLVCLPRGRWLAWSDWLQGKMPRRKWLDKNSFFETSVLSAKRRVWFV